MSAPPHQGTLLLVDDDAAQRAMLRFALQPKGFTIAECSNGDEALAAIRQRSFDVVLLDVRMAGMSGLEVLERLRAQRSMAELPVIMATAMDRDDDVVKALGLGANDYVIKPFDYPVVLARVRTQVSLRRSVEQIRHLEENLAQRNAELERANHRYRRDLEAAAKVQGSLLPAAPPQVAGLRFAWEYLPCVELAGDLLNVVVLDSRRVALYVFDVVGHGAQAALLAVMVSRTLGQLLASPEGCPSPAEVAARLNAEFPYNDQTEQFFTLLFGILDADSGEFNFVSAGHPEPLRLVSGRAVRCVGARGRPIGLGDTYEENRITLERGGRLYLYSDGLVETPTGSRGTFGEDRLFQHLAKVQHLPLADGLTSLMRGVGDWCGDSQAGDDISILAVERA